MENNNIHTFVVLAYKKSKYLEECVKSVLNQNYKSKILIATTTPNDHIEHIADKYKIQIVEGTHTNIGGDFDFAKNCTNTELVTIAHQDDIYEKEYSQNVVDAYCRYPDASIIFTDYYEIRNNKKDYLNINLFIKRILVIPLRIKYFSKFKFWKRWVIRFGVSISCPAVSFINNNVPKKLFSSDYKANVDWFAWEKLSRKEGKFIFINKPLMGHRISEESETTKIINSGERTNEDYEIYKKFWPKWIAKLFAKCYRNSETHNKKYLKN